MIFFIHFSDIMFFIKVKGEASQRYRMFYVSIRFCNHQYSNSSQRSSDYTMSSLFSPFQKNFSIQKLS